MSKVPKTVGPLNLLSLDGGGIRTVSQLVILNEIMKRVMQTKELNEMPKPCDYFHLIGGSGTGGIIAILLGRLRMTAEQALEKYIELMQEVFNQANHTLVPSKLGGSYKAEKMREVMERIVHSSGNGELMHQNHPRQLGRTFVCTLFLHNTRYVQRLRTYPMLKNDTIHSTIWEAAYATAALPWLFKPIGIEGFAKIKQSFIGAETNCSNPTKEVVEEAKEVFDAGCHVQLILSIGSGHPGPLSLPHRSIFPTGFKEELLRSLMNMSLDCERTADELAPAYKKIPNLYFRLNVTHGAGLVGFEEYQAVSELWTHTHSYLQDDKISKEVDTIVECLCNKQAKLQLSSLSVGSSIPESWTSTAPDSSAMECDSDTPNENF
ncbi:hypothetical protein M422DRAFT_39824 [Sphaerobolus stellatus SS14]|uniref:PNPLA domain-containing protein n=1 Tax=Sphaerobolus stellatus (strain SS14) TaxID=990650 RepID=A0A0C9T2R3_SPHS4|nr:hypothetical protein M422DRAFT_39824 [Sphaerobolus stellatus SS14]